MNEKITDAGGPPTRGWPMCHLRRGAWVGLALCALVLPGCRKPPAMQMPPPTVLVLPVAQRNVATHRDFIGTLDGSVNAQIHAQITGYLISQDYKDGDFVHKGDLLFRIDPRPFEASLGQAQANLAKSVAMANVARLEAQRTQELLDKGAATIDERDQTKAAADAADATVKADQAAVETARLQLNYTRIISPVDGVAGIAEAQVGNLVSPTGPQLTTVSTVDPIRVNFTVSEQERMDYLKRFPNPAMRAAHEEQVELSLILSTGELYRHKGKFLFAQREVDIQTGTIQLVGEFPNPGNILRPGQYAQVRVQTVIENALLVPQRAVTELQGVYQVAVVDRDDRAHIRVVEMGDRVGGDWIITKGLEPGQRAVVEGVQKVREGMAVNPQPYVPATQASLPSGGKASANTASAPAPASAPATVGASLTLQDRYCG